ncbi:hypothetical protein C0995_003879 [Termitomyces sp. Mi166|nr:hypothetical protein C0995_003879 [Termitomyces sp. Mi166\
MVFRFPLSRHVTHVVGGSEMRKPLGRVMQPDHSITVSLPKYPKRTVAKISLMLCLTGLHPQKCVEFTKNEVDEPVMLDEYLVIDCRDVTD